MKNATKTKTTKTTSGEWYETGWEAVGEEAKRQESRRANYDPSLPRRFWVGWKRGENKAEIIFVDGDSPLMLREHEFIVNNDWKNKVYKTCLVTRCPYCESGNVAYAAVFFTIIDLREWKSKDGKKSGKNEIKLMAAKTQAAEILHATAERRKGLAGLQFAVTRTGKTSPRVGDIFDFVKKVDLKNAKTLQTLEINGPVKVIDYKKLLVRESREKAQEWLQNNAVSVSSYDEVEAASDDVIEY